MKTIILGLNWLGDIIMSLPAIIAAADSGEIHIVTRAHLADVYGLAALPLTIHSVATNAGLLEVVRQLQPLRRLQADHTIVLPDSLRAAVIAKFCKGTQSTGFATQFRSFMLGKAVKKPENYTQLHEADLHFMLVKEAGLTQQMTRPEIRKGSFSDDVFARLAAKLKLDASKDFIVLAPGAAFGAAKRWPPAKFSALANLLARQFQMPLVVTASASEQQIVEDICKNSDAELINAAGQTDLQELACLLSRAKALVANDSGTMHLAALYATPTVVPVGPTDMVRTSPLNRNFIAITATNVCPLAPCRQRTCSRDDHICMESITPQDVLAGLTSLLSQANAT